MKSSSKRSLISISLKLSKLIHKPDELDGF